MCNRGDLLVSYVYDEISDGDRREVEGHLAACVECREEVAGLRSTRGYLGSWAPPQPDLGFRVIRGGAAPAPAPAPPQRRLAPAFGFAAAAAIVLAASAAIANLEVTYGTDGGLTVRTGWGRPTAVMPAAEGPEPSGPQPASTTEFAELHRRLNELEQALEGAQGSSGVQSASTTTRSSDADLLRQVRAIVREAESRQQAAFAQQLLQVVRDLDVQRRADLQLIQRGIGQYQGLTNAQFESTREQINQLYIRANSRQER